MLRSINFFEHSLPFPPPHPIRSSWRTALCSFATYPLSSTLVETSDLETLDLSLKTATGFSASPDASLSLFLSFSLFWAIFFLLCVAYPMQAVNLPSWLFFSPFDTIISSHTFFLFHILPFFSLCHSNFPLYLFEALSLLPYLLLDVSLLFSLARVFLIL